MSRNQDGSGGPTTRLPDIYASPGNVGVQIDSYRTKDLFNRPRSNKFTTAFQGHMYEDHTLKNAKRMLARELQRKREDDQRVKKLAEYQMQRLEAKVQLDERRKHREYLRRQRAWERQQAMKAASQLALEHSSAVQIQARHRGWRVRRALARQTEAATAIQSNLRRYRAQHQYTLQKLAHRDLQRQSAVKIQSHVRRYVSAKQVRQMKASLQLLVDTPRSLSTGELISTSPEPPSCIPLSPVRSDLRTTAPIKEDGMRPPAGVVHTPTPPPPRPTPPSTTANVILKRVGGGFRRIVQPPQTQLSAMLLSSSRSPMPSLALTPTKKRLAKPQPPQRSFLQRWNEVPSPVAKALESFIQDPNLVEKLKIVSSPSMEPPVVWRSRDAAELCAAMDASFPVAEPLDFEEMQPPLTPQDVAELTTAMEDMANLHDTVPECFDTDTPFVPLEKPPSRPEVADSLQPLGIAVDPTIFQWLPNALVTQEGEWTVLLDEDFDAKAAHAPISLSPPHNPDDGDDDQRIERSETTSSASSSDIEENEYKQATVTTVAAHKHRHRPKSILKKSVVTHPMAPVMAVGSSQFSLRKDPKHTHWKVDHDTCDDIPLGGALLPRY